MRGHSQTDPDWVETDPVWVDTYARRARTRIWAPEVGFCRWRVGPLAFGVTWPYNHYWKDRFTLLGGRCTLTIAGNGDRKLEAVVTVLGVTVGLMFGSYYATLELA